MRLLSASRRSLWMVTRSSCWSNFITIAPAPQSNLYLFARLQEKIAACKSKTRGPLHACKDDTKPLAQCRKFMHAMLFFIDSGVPECLQKRVLSSGLAASLNVGLHCSQRALSHTLHSQEHSAEFNRDNGVDPAPAAKGKPKAKAKQQPNRGIQAMQEEDDEEDHKPLKKRGGAKSKK